MPQSESFSREVEDVLGSMLQRTSDRLDALKVAVQTAKHFRAVLKALTDHVSQNRPLHVLSLMEKHDSFARELCESGQYSLDEWHKVRERAEEQARKLLIRYPKLLEEACKEAGLNLDMTSRFPVYTFENGFIEVILDREGNALLSSRARSVRKFPGDIGAVVEKVKKVRSDLFERPFDGDIFLRNLRKAYLHSVKALEQQDGAGVPIGMLVQMVGAVLHSEQPLYWEDHFIVDLSRLVRTGPLEIDGRRLELEHTRDQDQGILLHNADTFGYIGFARFEEVGS